MGGCSGRDLTPGAPSPDLVSPCAYSSEIAAASLPPLPPRGGSTLPALPQGDPPGCDTAAPLEAVRLRLAQTPTRPLRSPRDGSPRPEWWLTSSGSGTGRRPPSDSPRRDARSSANPSYTDAMTTSGRGRGIATGTSGAGSDIASEQLLLVGIVEWVGGGSGLLLGLTACPLSLRSRSQSGYGWNSLRRRGRKARGKARGGEVETTGNLG